MEPPKQPPRPQPRLFALWVAVAYALAGGLYIGYSDRILASLIADAATLTQFQTYKGWPFIALTAFLLYFLLDALDTSERRLRETLENVHLIALALDAEGNVTYCNDFLLQLTAWRREELLGRNWIETMVPDAAPVRAMFEQAMRGGSLPLHYENEIRTREGERRMIRWNNTFLRDRANRIVGSVSLGEDITERKRAEAELRESEERYRDLVENGQDLICTHDLEGRLLSVNPAVARLSGYSREALLEMNLADLLTPQARKRVPAYLSEIRTMGAARGLLHVRTAGGELRWWEYDNTLRTEGVPVPVVRGMAHDVTERKAANVKIGRLTQLYAALSQCNEAIVRAAGEQELFTQVCRAAVQFGGTKIAWIGLLDAASRRVRPAAAFGEGSEYLQGIEISTDGRSAHGRGLIGTALRENRPVWCQDYANDPRTAPWHELGDRAGWASMAVLPLHKNGVVIGVFVLFSGERDAFDEAERGLLVSMALNVSYALDHFFREDERRKAEAALRESDARYRALFECNPLPTLAVDRETLKFLAINQAAIDTYGYSRDEFLAMTIADLPVPEDRARVRAEVRERYARAPGEVAHSERRHVTKSGRMLFVNVVAQPLQLGERQARLISISDVTERKRAEQELKKRSQAIEQSPVSVVITDTEGRIEYVNPNFTQVTGYSAGEVIGQNSRLLQSRERPPESYRELWQTITSGATWRGEFRNRRKDGSLFWESATISPIVDADGRVTHYIGVKEDITERKLHEGALRRLNEELERRVEERTHALRMANQELEAFAYSVSHDLRTPLRAINGFSRLLDEEYAGRIDEPGRDMLRRVGAAAETMGRLIDDLLDLSRISRKEMRIGAVDLSALSRELGGELQAAEPERSVAWVIAPQVQAEGDPGLLRVVLQNLIGNAWKYSSRREAARIEFGVGEKDGRPAYFVRDNGAGFDMAYAAKLFGAFQRLHSAAEFPGSGIGLATVARIIRRHGGEVWADARLGEGASFYFTLRSAEKAAYSAAGGAVGEPNPIQ